MDDDLVQKPRLETLPSDVRPEHDHVAAVGRLLGDAYGLLGAHVQKLACDALDDRGLGGGIVPEHEERAAIGAAVEPGLKPVLHVLRPPADEQRSGRSQDLVDRLARSTVDPRHPLHVVVATCDEAVEAHHRVPEQLAHLDPPLYVVGLDPPALDGGLARWEPDRLGESPGRGIGLRNVNERLRVIYGATCQLRLQSVRGQGTSVRLDIPDLVVAERISA